MKKLAVLFLILIAYSCQAQSITRRAMDVNTVSDARLQAEKNFFIPRYFDTTAANLAKGIDSCGAIIYTYVGDCQWLRACNPKRWVKNGGGVVGGITNTAIVSGSGDNASPLVADVRVSTTGPNAIQSLPDGLYVPNVIRNGLVYGGTVTWISGYSYHITAAGYYINNIFYTSPATDVTLPAANPDSNRIDMFIVNNQSQATTITGTPASNPQEPAIDVSSQLRLSIALVEHGTTQPSATNLKTECVYRENNEWTATASTTRINAASTTAPCVGTKAVEGTSTVNADYIQFARPGGNISVVDSFKVITFQIKPKSYWGSGKIVLQWYNNGTPKGGQVNLTGSSYGFSSNLLTCQTVSIPLTDFGMASGTSVGQLRFTVVTSSGSIGWYLDQICLQSQTQTTYATPITLQNGLNLDPNTNIGELGGTLLHNTTNYTNGFIHTLGGQTIYNYPYQFQQIQNFGNSTSIVSFKSAGAVYNTSADYNNNVKLGVNYTSDVYNNSPATEGYFGDRIGYMLNTNLRGHGSYGLVQDDSSAKDVGIFFHTKDNTYTDGVTIFAGAATNTTGDYSATGLKTHKAAIFKTTGALQLPKYGSGTFTGTATKNLQVDASGNVIEGALSSGSVTSVGLTMPAAFTVTGSPVTSSGTLAVTGAGTTAQYIRGDGSLASFPTTISGITANNGLTASTSTNVQLGGTLIQSTTIDGSTSYKLTLTGSYSTNAIDGLINITNTNSTSNLNVGLYSTVTGTNASSTAIVGSGSGSTQGVQGISTSGNGVYAQSSSGNALKARSTSGNGANIQSDTGVPIVASTFSASGTNGVVTMITLTRDKSGTAANGIGSSIDFSIKASDGFGYVANQLISKWTDVTLATRTSQYEIWGTNSGTTGRILAIGAGGALQYNVNVVSGTTNTLTVNSSAVQVFSGASGSTWTMPAVSGNTGLTFIIKNRGSASITLNSNAGGSDLYDTSAVTSITITAGQALRLTNDGTYYVVTSKY